MGQLFYQVEELVPGAGVAEEDAAECRRGGHGVRLFHAAEHHAAVARLDDHRNPQRLERLLDAVAYLDGEPLLDLETARERLDDACYLAEPRDLPVGDVGDMALAYEGEHVVLACAVQVDVLYQDHLLVLLVEHGALDYLDTIFTVSLGKELQTLRDTLGCLYKSLSVRVFAQEDENLSDVLGDLRCGFVAVIVNSFVGHGAKLHFFYIFAANYTTN